MPDKQIIISVGREYGSGGHAIAEILSRRFELPFFDRNLLEEIAQHKEVDVKSLEKYDETPRMPFLSRTVRGFNNSPEENIAMLQFDFLKKMANEGKSFVIVGRCSENVLKEFPGLISFYILGDRDVRIERIMQVYAVSREKAEDKVKFEYQQVGILASELAKSKADPAEIAKAIVDYMNSGKEESK